MGSRAGAIASSSAMIAVRELGVEASAIQGSVYRELRPDFMGAEDVRVEYSGIGQVPVGHTGMTIRGQFLESLQDRIRRGLRVSFVADADHVPLCGDSREDWRRFHRFIDESRDRTFFTLDPHSLVDASAATPRDRFRRVLPAIRKAAEIVSQIKSGEPYVLELSVDEEPGVTSAAEMAYLADYLASRGVRLFSIAPALGFSKKDEDTEEMGAALRAALPGLHRIARDHGLVLGIHSGDGKSRETLRAIGELTEGKVWYKVSPDRQRLLFRVLEDSPAGSEERSLFEQMSGRLRDLVGKGAVSASAVHAADGSDGSGPSAAGRLFYDFGFLLARDLRPRLAALGEDFFRRYAAADAAYIRTLAECLGVPRPHLLG